MPLESSKDGINSTAKKIGKDNVLHFSELLEDPNDIRRKYKSSRTDKKQHISSAW